MATNTEILVALQKQVTDLQAQVKTLQSAGVEEAVVKGWITSALTAFFKKATG